MNKPNCDHTYYTNELEQLECRECGLLKSTIEMYEEPPMNKPSFKCIELWKSEFRGVQPLKYEQVINEIINIQESEGYTYHETVDIGDSILIYFKLTLYIFDNSTSLS